MRVWDPKLDGWLATEDLGRVAPDGVEVFGRSSDSVKVLGELVSVLRVEEAARRWADSPDGPGGGLDVAAIALPHPRLGHELIVVLAGGKPGDGQAPSASDLLRSLLSFSRDALLPYEQPHRIAWVNRIPRTALGKCRRALLASEVSLQPRAEG
jgi:acyl-CoA synthetase (AMP-forming)/AMP-acid ligase II